tara:strand:+ start:180 stop:1115 length:936 start_codon:yes stop_codon:yes gene_type:complete
MEMKVQVIYAPGTWGNTLRWMLDRFSKGSKFAGINSPWDIDVRNHGFSKKLFNNRFIREHQLVQGKYSPIKPNTSNIVVRFNQVDFVFVERCGFYRNPGYETEEKRYTQIIKQADKNFVEQTFGARPLYGNGGLVKCVAKELYKIRFHDLKNNTYWNAMSALMQDGNNYQFDLSSMFSEDKLFAELESVSERFNLDLNIDNEVIVNVVQGIRNSYVVETKDRFKQVLDAISLGKDISCGDCDIVEQAFIESELEKTNDSVLFPYGVNWFENTICINEFLTTYPKYLRHMNPRLPWYNDIKNPFYLTGRIDK